MADRFGEEEFRHNVKYFEVLPEKNLKNDELSKVLGKDEVDTYDIWYFRPDVYIG